MPDEDLLEEILNVIYDYDVAYEILDMLAENASIVRDFLEMRGV